ncbi:hypothetical protein [Paenibacillus castaneae]|nr:hypothetical protein [Paenibacillus castaneae]
MYVVLVHILPRNEFDGLYSLKPFTLADRVKEMKKWKIKITSKS